MFGKRIKLVLVCLWLIASVTFVAAVGQQEKVQEKVSLKFFFPVGVAGPLAKLIGDMTSDFNAQQPNIYVEPVYAGGYTDAFTKALTAARGGNPPDVAILTAADVWSSIDSGVIMPLDPLVKKEGGKRFLDQFFAAFIEDCTIEDQTWAIPFQKSTPIFYYNQDLFREVGLDPKKAPDNWQELVEFSKKLLIRKGDDVTRWGLEIPLDQWLVSAYIMQNGGQVNNPEGNRTFLDSKEAIGALQFLADMAQKHKIMPPKKFFGDASADFVAGSTAMMYNSTGGLTFVRKSATFAWNVAFLPAGKVRATPTGGGQFVMYKGIPESNQNAAWSFIIWMTNPENAARWSMGSGYVAVNKAAFETGKMKEYIQEVPQALTAREQLTYARREPPATHDARKIAQIMSTAAEKALAGVVSAEAAFTQAQKESEEILKAYR